MRSVVLVSVASLALSGCIHWNHIKRVPSPPPPAAPVVDTAADEAEIKTIAGQIMAAINAHDPNAIMTHYADNVLVFDIVPPRQYVGTAAYGADFAEFFKAVPDAQMDLSDIAVTSDGQMAWSHGMLHVTGKQGKHKVDMTLRLTDVWQKSGGAWKIVHEHISVPVDLAHNKPDLTSKP